MRVCVCYQSLKKGVTEFYQQQRIDKLHRSDDCGCWWPPSLIAKRCQQQHNTRVYVHIHTHTQTSSHRATRAGSELHTLLASLIVYERRLLPAVCLVACWLSNAKQPQRSCGRHVSSRNAARTNTRNFNSYVLPRTRDSYTNLAAHIHT